MNKQMVLILDMGGRYKELIAKRIRQCGVLSRIIDGSATPGQIAAMAPAGIVLTGGRETEGCDPALFSLGIPVLAIDMGAAAMVTALGGRVEGCAPPEEPKVEMRCNPGCPLFEGLDISQTGYFANTVRISAMPEGFEFITVTDDMPLAGVAHVERKLYGVQFHPENSDTVAGAAMIKNFLFNICGAEKTHTLDNVGKELMQSIRDQAAGQKVLLAVSGGALSLVCAALMAKAIPGQLRCVMVDTGFLTAGQVQRAADALKELELEFITVDAQQRFLTAAKNAATADEKNQVIGAMLVEVLQEQGQRLDCPVLALGTAYTDHRLDAFLSGTAFARVMKPLDWLFRDEALAVGARINMSGELLYQQIIPFTGVATRVIGPVTVEKLDIVRRADDIFAQEMENSIVMADSFFSILTTKAALGGDGQEPVIILRAVTQTALMGNEYAPVTQSVLGRISSRIHREVGGISRVLFDITADTDAPVEW